MTVKIMISVLMTPLYKVQSVVSSILLQLLKYSCNCTDLNYHVFQ